MNYVFDIETISIESNRLNDYKEHFEPVIPEEEVETNPKTGKPKRARTKVQKSDKAGLHWLTGRIICVGIKPEGKTPVMFMNKDEEILLRDVYNYLNDRKPITLISFNGKAFDQPFIIMRGMLYGLRFRDILPSERYSKNHIDLYEEIGSGKWALPCKLSEAAWFFGLPDIEGSGSDVQRLYNEGKIDEIINHCRSDICSTEKLFYIMYEKRHT